MKIVKLKHLHIENFKGCKERDIDFSDRTFIKGQNALGKTTIFDSFTFLLFNKDSQGNTKFNIRPLDQDGNVIHNVDISVQATIEVDGEEHVLKKTQREKWVKKRGTQTKELQGNVNEFEINGYPKSEKEFKEFVADIIDEQIFVLVTNPMGFTSMPWKEQREILMKFVGNFSDVEIAEKYGDRFEKLIPELKVAGTNDISKKYSKQKSMLNKEMTEIPARIDEVSKQLVFADVKALEIEKQAKEVALSKLNEELKKYDNQERIAEKRSLIMNLKFKLSDIQNVANQKLLEESADIRNRKNVLEQEAKMQSLDFKDSQRIIKRLEAEKANIKERGNKINEEYSFWKSKEFGAYEPIKALSDEDMICPTCGRELDEDVKLKRIATHKERAEKHKKEWEDSKEKFEIEKKENMDILGTLGKSIKDELEIIEKKIEEETEHSKELTEAGMKNAESLAEVIKQINELPISVDITGSQEYIDINKNISSLEEEISKLSATSTNNDLELKIGAIKDEIRDIEIRIASADNSKVQARIDELEEEQKQVGQKLADTEQMLDMVDDFVRTKMNIISDEINKKFEVVNFILFKNQINGGLAETCECMVNGVPFSSLNNGHRIVSGLDIIHSLSELYQVSCPIFIDNAESINLFNIPKTESQMILLEVSDDKELVIQ